RHFLVGFLLFGLGLEAVFAQETYPPAAPSPPSPPPVFDRPRQMQGDSWATERDDAAGKTPSEESAKGKEAAESKSSSEQPEKEKEPKKHDNPLPNAKPPPR